MIDWDDIREKIWVSNYCIVVDNRLDQSIVHDRRLFSLIEDHIAVEDDGVERIQWHEVQKEYDKDSQCN